MKFSSLLLIVAFGVAYFPAFAQKPQSPSLCTAKEESVFSCTLQGPSRKTVSLCALPAASQQDGQSFRYLYGRPSKIELQYPASGNGREAFTFTRLFYAGGTAGYAHSLSNEGYKYILYSIEGTNNRSGLLVQRTGQSRASRHMVCQTPTVSETKNPELMRITSEWQADADIEAHGLPSIR